MNTSCEHSTFFYCININLQGRYTYANSHYQKTFIAFGTDLENVDAAEKIDATKLEHAFLAQKKILTGLSVSEIVNLKKKKITGETIWTEWEFLPIFDDNMVIIGLSCTGYDIPNYLEKAIEQSNHNQQLINSFADASSAQISLKDEQYNYISCNQQLADYLNLNKNEVYLKSDNDFYEPEIAKQFFDADIAASKLLNGNVLITQSTINNRFYRSQKFPVLLDTGLTGIGCITIDITDEKNYEQEILRKEDVLKNLTNNLNVSIGQFRMSDINTIKWEFSSNEISNIIGVTLDEIDSDPFIFHKMLTDNHATTLNTALQHSMHTEESLHIDVQILTRLKVTKWIEIMATVKKQTDGSVLFFAIFRDVTYRKDLEKELEVKELFLKNLTDNVNGVVTQFRTKKNIPVSWDFASRRVNEIYEISFETLQKNPTAIREMIPHEELKILQKKMYGSSKKIISQTYQHTITTPSGKQKWIEFTAFSKLQKDNSVIWYGFHQDITEKKKLELENKANQDLVLSITNNLNVVVSQFKFEKIDDYSWKYMSDNALKLYEVSAADVLLNSNLLVSMIHPDDRAEVCELVTKSFLTNLPLYNVRRVTTPSGKLKWIEVNSYPEKQPDGSCVWNGFHLDITDRKLLEQENIKNQNLLTNLTNTIEGAIIQVRYNVLNEPTWEFVSNGIEKLYEIDAQHLFNNPMALYKMIVPEHQKQFDRAIEFSYRYGTTIQHTMRVITPSGKQKWIRLKSTPTKEKDEEIVWRGFYEDITDAKLLEIENKKNQDLITNLNNNIDVVSSQIKYINYKNLCWQFVSNGVEKLYEVTFDDLKINPFLIRNMAEKDTFKDLYRKIINAKKTEKTIVEFQITTPSGIQKWVQTSIIPKFNSDKSVTIYAFQIDITAKKELENKIIENEKILNSLTNNVNGMLTQLQVFDENNIKWNFLSDGVKKLYEIDKEKLTNNPFALFQSILSEDYEKAKLNFIQCQINNTFYFSQHRIRVPNGQEKWIEVKSTPIRQEDGSTIWNGFHHDITVQKKFEIKNKQTQEQFDFIVNNTASALILIENNKIAYISKNYKTIFGFSIEEEMIVINNSMWNLVHFDEERTQIRKQTIDAFKKQDKNILLQYQYLHKNGKLIWRQERVNIFYNAHGRAVKVVDIVSDITKTKRLENLIHRKNEQLALQLTEKEKITENFVAFQNSKWEEIAANLHDNISQLLFATNLHLNNFTNEHSSYEKAKDILQIALNEIKYITQATKNLVIQDKGLQIALKEFIENNNYLNNIKITKIAHAEFYKHFSNSEQIILFTIIQEIIQNAIKHSKSTDVFLILSIDNEGYKVKVIDNGVGMPANYVNGMGIYNIEKNVHLLNGTIKMYNDDGLTVEINLN